MRSMVEPQVIMNKMAENKGKFTSSLMGLMGYKMAPYKVNNLLEGLDENIHLDDALCIISIERVKSFICWSSGYPLCTQLFIEINKILNQGTTVIPKSILRTKKITNFYGADYDAMDEETFKLFYSPATHRGVTDDLRMYAQFLTQTMYLEPFERFGLATVSLGITYLMVWSGVGYCLMDVNHVSDIIELMKKSTDARLAEDYVITNCFKLFN